MVTQDSIWQKGYMAAFPAIALVAAISFSTGGGSATSAGQSTFASMALSEALVKDVTESAPPAPSPARQQSTSTSSSVTTNTSSQSNVSAQVTVNGKDVSLPESGSMHKTISDENGTTTVDVTIDGQGDSSSSSTSSVDVQIDSEASLDAP